MPEMNSKHANTKLPTILKIIFFIWAIHIGIDACKISEFACRGGSICLPLDKYCDGRDDCGDSSDEPKFCTVCNRTYYGDIGRTYSLRVPPPQWNRLPFLCHITFTASGHEQGDIVQIIFDAFSVGRFDEGLVDSDSESSDTTLTSMGDLPGCPEGFMQLSELGRPFTGGSWCGAATGPQLYYSETSTVTASVKVFHAPMQAATPFEFKIRYKFISQSDAVVRYGAPNELLELGKVTPGTYCTRQFDECYRKKCRLQSPNYPGMYPRNVTCYWTIRQKTVPTCKHAMVSVSQENAHKALVKRSIASLNKTFRSIRAWSDCTGERDHLIFYDGSSTNDPVLAKYCGGDWLPKVVSRGPEMLVAFHSSPFSAPLQSNIPNRGFELDVDMFFVDSDSHDYAQGSKGICEFNINASNTDDVLFSRRGRMGKILSPRHTLPPNTTCTYYFHGQPGDLIWISFTSYNLQILQHAIQDNNTLGRNDLPPWITRLRIWDSVGSSISSIKTTAPISATTPSNRHSNINNLNNTVTTSNYYYSPQNPIYGKNIKVNIDNVWNPVDSYIYGPTQNSIFNQPNNKFGGGGAMASQKFEKFSNGIAGGGGGAGGGDGVRDTYNYIVNNVKDGKTTSVGGNRRDGGGSINNSGNSGYRDGMTTSTTANSIDGSSRGTSKPSKHSTSRKLIAEHYDNETPRLCDHSLLENSAKRMRPCSPLESYVSTSKDLKIEFHSHTGTALYPASFSLNYEFVDTDLGGENWLGRRGEDPVPALCSRIFRKRRGNFQSPRNVFLHGRGGAKNISCLYRFEAGVGERVRLVLHNVSFGDAATCNTETDLHTGRPKCTPSDAETENVRQGELKILDVPYRDVKITLGCFCDNTSSLYSTPLAVQSYSRTMELMFTVTNLNISEDFADVYFHASYEYIRVPDCPKRMRLRGSGGEEDASFPLRSKDASCEGLPWFIEAQQNDRSLFVKTWGTFLPMEPTVEDSLRCMTRNRLIVYSGKPLKIVRIICPGQPEPRQSALHIFSEDWISQQPSLFAARPVNIVVEPIFRDPGNIGFQWMEIQRTRASQIQQLEMHTNFSLNDTLNEFGFIPRDTECEYKCPELDACIAANLWCDASSSSSPSARPMILDLSDCSATNDFEEIPSRERQDVLEALQSLASKITHGTKIGYRIAMTSQAAMYLDKEYVDVLKIKDPYLLLQSTIDEDSLNKLVVMNDIMTSMEMTDKEIAEYLAEKISIAIIASRFYLLSSPPTLKMAPDNCTLWGYDLDKEFRLFLELCPSTPMLGNSILQYSDAVTMFRKIDINESPAMDLHHSSQYFDGVSVMLDKIKMIIGGKGLSHKKENTIHVELLIKAHECFVHECYMEGIAIVLQRAKLLNSVLTKAKSWSLIVRMLTGIGRYRDMYYCFETLMKNAQFESLLGQFDDDKSNGLKQAIISYLNEHYPEATEYYRLAAVHFSIYKELSLMSENNAKSVVAKVIGMNELKNDDSNIRSQDETLVTYLKCGPAVSASLTHAMEEYANAAENYLLDNKLNLAQSAAYNAELIALQIDLNNREIEKSNDRCICVMNIRSANVFRSIVNNNLSVPQSIILSHTYPYEINWTEAMFNQYILLSNEKFLIDFCDRYSLTDEMIENLVKNFQNQTNVTAKMEQHISNLIEMVESVTVRYRLASLLGLKRLVAQLINENSLFYLKDTNYGRNEQLN